MNVYLRPDSLEQALAALDEHPLVVLAGGTDFYPARIGRAIEDDILDISAIAELRTIDSAGACVRIGAAATWSDLLSTSLPPSFDCLKLAAREVGGVQIQNTGTIAGNICNASPAADGVPALLALDTQLELRSAQGTRVVRLADFILGNRRTACRADELVTAILVPRWGERTRSTFLKLGARKYLVISIAMVAAIIATASDGTIERSAVAVGACSAVAQRLTALERELLGHLLAPGIGEFVTPRHLAPLTPISDIRGSATYRSDAVATLVRRALERLARE
jgi:CO/xanthine dehydrogenase FAD-binding subunit